MFIVTEADAAAIRAGRNTAKIQGTNPVHAVRGPKHVMETGKTTVLDAELLAASNDHSTD